MTQPSASTSLPKYLTVGLPIDCLSRLNGRSDTVSAHRRSWRDTGESLQPNRTSPSRSLD